jgi:hypothetical protein
LTCFFRSGFWTNFRLLEGFPEPFARWIDGMTVRMGGRTQSGSDQPGRGSRATG